MSKRIMIPSKGQMTLTDNDYLSSGGEAEVFVKGRTAYKIYHDVDKMITERKMNELKPLSARSNIIIPKSTIYDLNNNPIGFTMPFVKDTEPLIKLFSNNFKRKHGLGENSVNEIINKVQDTLSFIHANKILVVDLNELNLLVSENFDDVYFIDVDSYQTSSAKATAIMASIRDPLVQNQSWHNGSDWFSFAVLIFQMWIGSHPYKGSHPNYKKKEWIKRMAEGVSVFDSDARLPRMCNDLSIIPTSHYQWMEAVFQNGERSSPPKMGDVSIAIVTKQNIVIVNESFDIKLVSTFSKEILDCYDVMGVKYFVAKDGLYKGEAKLPIDLSGVRKAVFSPATGFAPVVAKLQNDMLTFCNLNGREFSKISATDITTRDNTVYSISGDQLYEHTCKVRNGKDMHEFRVVCTVMKNSIRSFDGIFLQTMLKKQVAIIPYEKGKCAITNLEELNDSRVIDAKCERNICVVLAENNRLYNRHIFVFEPDFKGYAHRVEEDVSITEINFTVLPSGVTVMATESSVIMFKDATEKHIPNAPFSSDNKLFNISGSVHYVDGNKIYQASVKR